MIHDMIYLLTAIGLTPGGSSTIHIYTQTVHGTTQITNCLPHISRLDMICLLIATGLSPGDSTTAHIYTQTIHGTT